MRYCLKGTLLRGETVWRGNCLEGTLFRGDIV